MEKYKKLFEPGNIGDIKVKNRIFMAPLTRNRAKPDGTHSDMAIEYYTQRASAGLIITEGAQIHPLGKGYYNTPGIYTEKHVQKWKEITDSVHKRGGKIFIQLWHVGRISHNSLLPDGEVPVGPSAIAATSETYTAEGRAAVSPPRELTLSEVKEIPAIYAQAAKCSMEADFDGVEIHGANGYLLNQFIATNTNQRTDEYGGSPENRARLLLEVVDAISNEIGAPRVGLRLSPAGTFNDIFDEEILTTYSHIYKEIDKRNLAYLHVIEKFPLIDISEKDKDIITTLRKSFSGNYIANGEISPETAEERIGEETFAVAFGRSFISNPDLPERIKKQAPLNDLDPDTFYGGNEKGYTDYPSL